MHYILREEKKKNQSYMQASNVIFVEFLFQLRLCVIACGKLNLGKFYWK